MVYLMGAVQKSSTLNQNDVLFTLPTGFRPAYSNGKEGNWLTATGGTNVCKVKVTSDGAVIFNGSSTSSSYVFLNGVSFPST